jgi:thiol-disulfide isomerase/thioredoxin
MRIFIISFLLGFLPGTEAFAQKKEMSALSVLVTSAPVLNTKKPLKINDLKGKIVLVDFWTYGCINCQQVIPDLKFLEKKYPKELVILGVHSAKFENERGDFQIKKAAARFGIDHPVINDSKFVIWNSFNVKAWPTMVLIEPDGNIYKSFRGEGHRASLDQGIAELSKKYQGKISLSEIKLVTEKHKMPFKFPSKMIEVLNFKGDGKAARLVFFLSDSSHNEIVGLEKNGKEFLRIGKDSLNMPHGLAFKEDILYIADTGNHSLKAYDFSSKKISNLGGDGTRGRTWASPWDLEFIDQDTVAIAMAGTHQLYSYNTKNKKLTLMAGSGAESIDDGPLPKNSLSQPSGLSRVGDKLYFVDAESSSLRVLEKGSIKTLIGKGLFKFGLIDGDRETARMQHTTGVYGTEDKVYLADSYNNAIRVYDVKSGKLSTLAKGLKEPNDVLLSNGELIVVSTGEHLVKRVNLSSGKVSSF